MSLTIAQAIKQIEELKRELAVWREVEEFLQGFIRQEEQDSIRKVITTEAWKSNLSPPMSIVVPQEVIKTIATTIRDLDIKPRQETLSRLQNLSVQEETSNGNGSAEEPAEEKAGKPKQGKQEGNNKGAAKPGRAKLRVTPESPDTRKTTRRLVPKPTRAG